MDVEKLISAIRQNEVLWNRSLPNYKSSRIKIQRWNRIASDLGVPVEECKRKWKTLRDCFTRIVKRTTGDSVVEVDEVNTLDSWKYRKSMEFLRHQLRPKKSKDTFGLNSTRPEMVASPETPSLFEELVIKSPLDSDELDSACVESVSSSPSESVEQKPIRDSQESDPVGVTSNKRPRLADHIEQDDEDELYCRYMLCKLKKFPVIARNQAKLELMGLLNKIEAKLEEDRQHPHHKQINKT